MLPAGHVLRRGGDRAVPALSAASPRGATSPACARTMRHRHAPDRAAADPGGAAITACSPTPIVRLVYQRGEFDAESTELGGRGAVLVLVLAAVRGHQPAAHAHVLLAPAAVAADRAGARARSCVNAVVSLALYGPLGIGGVVLGTAIASAAMTVLQATALRRELGGLRDRPHAARGRRDADRRGGARRSSPTASGAALDAAARRLAARADRLASALRARGRARASTRASCSRSRSPRRGRSSTLVPRRLSRPRRRLVTLDALMADQAHIRNFSIIAHIDHGKSTLADRILELTHTVDPRAMRAQLLDSMDLERERGITIKAQAVRVFYTAQRRRDLPAAPDRHARPRGLHLRGLALARRVRGRAAGGRRLPGRRGADRRQHLPGDRLRARADPDHEQGRPARRRARARGRGDRRADRRGRPTTSAASPPRPARASTTCSRSSSQRVPPPHGDPDAPPRALIFDSEYDQYRGVIAYIRVVDGTFRKGEAIRAMAAGHRGRDRRHRLLHARPAARRAALGGRGRLPDHRHQGRHAAARRRHADDQEPRSATEAAARLPRRQADGVLRPVPDEQRRLPGAARRAREADAQRRGAVVGAGDLRRARVRLPLRLPRPAAHGHRARAPGARVRPRADGDDAVGRVRDHAHRRHA